MDKMRRRSYCIVLLSVLGTMILAGCELGPKEGPKVLTKKYPGGGAAGGQAAPQKPAP